VNNWRRSDAALCPSSSLLSKALRYSPSRWLSTSAIVALLCAPLGNCSDGARVATGWSSEILPCSASLATIVAATPFDTDAQRNTVSGVTFSPVPSAVSP
jgi:hypothetical protein